jgi:two-component system, OmpR family, phosphate regulon sensor histidine kinase PhoR
MNKLFFRLLVFLMSLSLIGIILVQVYWFSTSFKNNDEQFKFHVKQVIGSVADKFQKQEAYDFVKKYDQLKDSIGKTPKKSDLLQFYYVQKNAITHQTIVYSNSLIAEDYNISSTFFDKKNENKNIKNFSSKRKTEIFNGNALDNNNAKLNANPDVKIEKSGTLDILKNVQFEIAYKDIEAALPIEQRISIEELQKKLENELSEYGVKTSFEFGIFSNGKPTKISSKNFKFKKNQTYSIPIFVDSDGNNKYQLLVSFPYKTRYLFSELMAISILSIIFTLIIVITYVSAINQLIKQRLISEIKTDFINNMTHEFKTPIATINLALDAIKNPKVIDNKEMVSKYLQMIRDENKRMHAQVENVLRISKLEKKELDIDKESLDVNEIIQDAVDHVQLILDDKKGTIKTNLKAKRKNCLINDVHFTNVIVNVLDNAIKYSSSNPEIEITTENVKDIIIISIKDHGVGMSKTAQKRIFEKFYREHTGDLHNVKGHGLGLSYVKRIVEDHNGQIFVESEKGIGSTFTIKIPLIN